MKPAAVIATSALTAFLVASLAAPATPRPKPAPPGARLAPTTLHELEKRVQALEVNTYDWPRFYRCLVKNYRVPSGASSIELRGKVARGCFATT